MPGKPIDITEAQRNMLVELTDTTDLTWKEKAEHVSRMEPGKTIDGEQARSAYRTTINGSHGSYSSKQPIGSPDEEKSEYEQGEDFINIICSSKRMLSKEDIIEKFKIDLNVWEIDRFKVKTSEGYRKDRQVEWDVEDGKTLHGKVRDSGKMLVVVLYHVEVRFLKKKQEVEAREVIRTMIEDAKQYAPQYPIIEYPEMKNGHLYEITMFDIHFGRLTWDEESGENYDIKLATKAVKSSLVRLLALVKDQNVDRILLPLGNDFFNVDSKFNTTTNGTAQQEDTRWQKTFRKGRELCVWMIDTCAQVAPVDVVMVPGNHDQQRSFYLGDALECWYHDSKNVNVNNLAKPTKYYNYGLNLIGFNHGSDLQLNKLPTLMALDEPELWAKTKYREWHTGDKHHKKELIPFADESSGMVVRIIRSLVSFDAWTFNSGYRSLRASESFLWSKDEGMIAQYTALPVIE